MKTKTIEIEFDCCRHDELTAEEEELAVAAAHATENSYARYSQFKVGAAVRLHDGRIVIGANQENAAFPSGLCAERTALFAAQAQYPNHRVTMLAIAARNEDGVVAQPVTPCGACRQVIAGVEDRQGTPMKVILYGTDCIYRIHSAKDLLPLAFADASMR